MLGFASRVDDDEVVVFSGLTSNPAISTAGDYIFRNVFSDADVGKRLAEVIIEEGFNEVGVMGEATDYIEGVRTEFTNNYEPLGGTILAAERYTSEETDFSAGLTRILADDPPAIVLLSQSEFAQAPSTSRPESWVTRARCSPSSPATPPLCWTLPVTPPRV